MLLWSKACFLFSVFSSQPSLLSSCHSVTVLLNLYSISQRTWVPWVVFFSRRAPLPAFLWCFYCCCRSLVHSICFISSLNCIQNEHDISIYLVHVWSGIFKFYPSSFFELHFEGCICFHPPFCGLLSLGVRERKDSDGENFNLSRVLGPNAASWDLIKWSVQGTLHFLGLDFPLHLRQCLGRWQALVALLFPVRFVTYKFTVSQALWQHFTFFFH